MYILQQFAPAAVVAFLVAVAIRVLARFLPAGAAQGVSAAVLGTAYACGHLMVAGWPGFPPADSTNWLLFIACAVAAMSALLAWTRPGAGIRLPAAAAAIAGALYLLLKPKLHNGWGVGEATTWISIFTAAALLLWLSLEMLANRGSQVRFAFSLLLLVPCAAMSAALLLSGSILLGQFSVVLTAAALGGFANWRGAKSTSEAFPAVALLYPGLLLSGYFYADLPAASALLLAAAALGGFIPGEIRTVRALLVRLGVVLVPAAAAVALAFHASPPLDY